MNATDIRAQRIVVGAYVLIESGRLGVSIAAQRSLIAACVLVAFDGGLMVALVRRHRWAWMTYVVLQLVAEPVILAIKAVTVVSGMVDLVQIFLLLSPQMRRYVKGSSALGVAADG